MNRTSLNHMRHAFCYTSCWLLASYLWCKRICLAWAQKSRRPVYHVVNKPPSLVARKKASDTINFSGVMSYVEQLTIPVVARLGSTWGWEAFQIHGIPWREYPIISRCATIDHGLLVNLLTYPKSPSLGTKSGLFFPQRRMFPSAFPSSTLSSIPYRIGINWSWPQS